MGPPSPGDDIRQIGTDAEAFTVFYRRHVDEVLRFVTRRVADPHLAADLTAEVFLAVIDASARYRGATAGPRAWLYGIARNVIAAESARPPGGGRPRPASQGALCWTPTTWFAWKSESMPPRRAATCSNRWRSCPMGSAPSWNWWPWMGSRSPRLLPPCGSGR